MQAAVAAGAVELDVVMTELARRRPVFHSEADLRLAFVQEVQRRAAHLGREVAVRADLTSRELGAACVPLLVISGTEGTVVELAYAMNPWAGTTTPRDLAGTERLELRQPGPAHLARQRFVSAVERVESVVDNDAFGASVGCAHLTGAALLLTNAPGLWTTPSTRVTTHDRQFRIHEGRQLHGRLGWGTGTANRTRHVRGTYALHWNDFSTLDAGRSGRLRWLGVEVARSAPQALTASTGQVASSRMR